MIDIQASRCKIGGEDEYLLRFESFLTSIAIQSIIPLELFSRRRRMMTGSVAYQALTAKAPVNLWPPKPFLGGN
jgi:hypothetical protein